MISKRINHDLRKLVERELDSGERIQWINMPIPSYFTGGSMASFLFAIPWTAFAVFWIIGAWNQSENIVFTLFGVPFVLIGIGLLTSPLRAYRKASKTVYVITDKRAITFFKRARSTIIRSYSSHQLQDIYRKEKRNGTGSVVISQNAWRDSDGDRQSEELGFININDPKKIEKMLKQLAEQGRQTS